MATAQLSAAYKMSSFCKLFGLLFLLVTVTAHACNLRDNGDGTMTEPSSGLLIRSCAVGENWSGSDCTGVSTGYTWESALQNFNTGAWRLMTKEEAIQIAPNARTCWAVTGGARNSTWTSAPYPSDDATAYILNVKLGLVGRAPRVDKKDVRLVSATGMRGNGAAQRPDEAKSVGRGAPGG